jgi:hypothetical protein
MRMGMGLRFNGQQLRLRSDIRGVSPGYFAATNTRLVAGRLPAEADNGRAAVVSESFARACCGAGSPIGLVAEDNADSFSIVGVVKDIYTRALDEAPIPTLFRPLGPNRLGTMNYVLRVDRPDPTLALAAERAILAVNPRATVAEGGTMRARLLGSVKDRTFATVVSVFFAVAALGVSAAGLVGIVGFVVARRTREMAIRIAIGAPSRTVIRLVTQESTLAAAAGAAMGLAAAWWLSRTIASLLYGIRPADPIAFALAAALVVFMVTVAAWLPARRAVRLSPTVALRVE